jgi:hypothetical protein
VAYIEELTTPELRICKLWFTGRIVAGSLSLSRPAAAAEHIVEAAFLSVTEFEGRTIFPPILRDQYWRDRLAGFAAPRYLGIREMEFY